MSMRKCDKENIAVLCDTADILHRIQYIVINIRQVWIKFRYFLARMALRCQMYNLGMRVTVKKSDKFFPRIARRSDDTDLHDGSSISLKRCL